MYVCPIKATSESGTYRSVTRRRSVLQTCEVEFIVFDAESLSKPIEILWKLVRVGTRVWRQRE
jgi:hypothetical protein